MSGPQFGAAHSFSSPAHSPSFTAPRSVNNFSPNRANYSNMGNRAVNTGNIGNRTVNNANINRNINNVNRTNVGNVNRIGNTSIGNRSVVNNNFSTVNRSYVNNVPRNFSNLNGGLGWTGRNGYYGYHSGWSHGFWNYGYPRGSGYGGYGGYGG